MRVKATLQTVLSGIEKLMIEGDPAPTVDTVVEAVGGSKSTVARIMREHVAEIAELRDASLGMPTTVRDAFRQNEAVVWAAAEREARIRAREEVNRMERTMDVLRAHLDHHIELNQASAACISEQAYEIDKLSNALLGSENKTRELESMVVDLQIRLAKTQAVLEARADILAEMRTREFVLSQKSEIRSMDGASSEDLESLPIEPTEASSANDRQGERREADIQGLSAAEGSDDIPARETPRASAAGISSFRLAAPRPTSAQIDLEEAIQNSSLRDADSVVAETPPVREDSDSHSANLRNDDDPAARTRRPIPQMPKFLQDAQRAGESKA